MDEIEVPSALAPEHIAATQALTQLLPKEHHPDEVERALLVASMSLVMPLEKLDAQWAIRTLATELLSQQAKGQRTERLLRDYEIAFTVAAAVIMAAWALF